MGSVLHHCIPSRRVQTLTSKHLVPSLTRRSRSGAVYRRIPSAVATVKRPLVAIPPENFVKLPNREMSIYIAKSASLDSLRILGVDVLANTIHERHVFMTHKDVFRIVMGLTRLDVVANRSIMDAITIAIREHIRQFGAHELAGMAVELSACKRRIQEVDTTQLVSELVTGFSMKLSAAAPPDLANIAIACVDTGLVDAVLFGKLADSAVLQMGLFRGPELCDILLAFASLGVVHEDLLARSLPVLCKQLAKLVPPQLVDVGFICLRFGGVGIDVAPLVQAWTAQIESRVSELGELDRKRMADLACIVVDLSVPDSQVPKTLWLLRSRHEWRVGISRPDVLGKLGIDN